MYIEFLARKQQIKHAIVSAVIWGLLAHGYILFNKISYHDDIFCLYTLGGTYGSGRWSLGVLGSLAQRLVGGTYSAPALNGIISILIIAIVAAIITVMFQLEGKIWIWAVSAILETIPVVTATFAYMFTAPYYMLAMLLAVAAAFFISRQDKWVDINGVLAIICVAGAMGIYQAYFGVTVSCVLVYLIWNYGSIVQRGTSKESFVKLIVYGIRSVLYMGMGIVVYALENKFFLFITHYELSDYRGVNTMFDVTPKALFISAVGTYKSFGQMFLNDYVGLTSVFPIRLALWILWLVTLGCLIKMTVRYRKKVLCNIAWWIMILLLPMTFHIVNIMVSGGDTEVHTLMLYSVVMMYIFPVAIISREMREAGIANEVVKKGLKVCSVLAIYVVIFIYAVVDNQAYMRVELLQNQAKAFYNRLIERIENVDGYEATDTIYIVGILEADTSSLTDIPQFPAVSMTGYTMSTNDFINDYAWKEYVRWQLGTNFVYETQTPDEEMIRKMKCYPDDGSIQRIDGTVVVKFSDEK